MLWKIVFAHEWLLLRRRPLLLAGLAFLLLCGSYGLYAGHHFVRAQHAVLRSLEAGQAERLARHLARAQADTNTAQGRRDRRWAHNAIVSDRELAQVAAQPLAPLAGLAIGQRDVYPAYYPCRPWDDAYDAASGELRNPDQLLAGNFDLAFVLLYLVPLFAIAYAHNVLAEEHAQHTYRLLRVQAGSVRAVVGYKLLFRLGVVLALVLGLSLVGFWLNAVPLAPIAPWVGWLLLSAFYLITWFAGIYAIAAAARSAGAAALALLGAWVGLAVLGPAVLTYAQQRQQADPEALALVSVGRDQRTNPWQWPLPVIRAAFYRAAPRFASSHYASRDTTELRFLAYTELQHQQKDSVGTAQVREQIRLYRQTRQLAPLLPVLAAQQALNQLSQSELPDHLAFVQAVRHYQRQRRYFSYGYTLSSASFGPTQVRQFPVFSYRPVVAWTPLGWNLGVLAAWALSLAALGYYGLGRSSAS